MSGLSKKDLRVVLASLESQGCKLKDCTKGTMVYLPNGEAMTIHRTNSDHRSVLNQRARVLRAGLSWPLG